MPEKKPSSGTVAIVVGSILIAWGFFATLRGVLIAEPAAFVGLIMLGGGVALLVRGINTRGKYVSRDRP